jgi:hypothetical protein
MDRIGERTIRYLVSSPEYFFLEWSHFSRASQDQKSLGSGYKWSIHIEDQAVILCEQICKHVE